MCVWGEASLKPWEVWRVPPSVPVAGARVRSAKVFEVCVLRHLLASQVDMDCGLEVAVYGGRLGGCDQARAGPAGSLE